MLEVLRIEPQETYAWLLEKHYAHRIPSIMFAFGLYKQNWPIGIVTYGNCANNNLNEIAGTRAMELSRLVVNDDAPKNSASILVGRSLQMIPAPYAIVSYADAKMGHIGYVYQATNWIYTGQGSADTEFKKDGRTWHRKALFSRHGSGSVEFLKSLGYEPVKQEAKHRYLFFVGDKRQKRTMQKALDWPVLPYPKGDTRRYDASHQAKVQGRLF